MILFAVVVLFPDVANLSWSVILKRLCIALSLNRLEEPRKSDEVIYKVKKSFNFYNHDNIR